MDRDGVVVEVVEVKVDVHEVVVDVREVQRFTLDTILELVDG